MRVCYRIHVTPTQHQCPTCGQKGAEIHRIEIVEVVDEIAGKSIGWDTGVGAMVAWKVSAAHNQGKPICLTPACLKDLCFQNSITAAC
ncbi:MAG: hypothetical protein M1275_04110 [Patescibacteria group bacterium]|nr:hypothetical protein [Patescibacteria group bacterium]